MSSNNNSDKTKNNVNDEIYKCLDQKEPKSFFLFAGAGSGKTRSLVNILKMVKNDYGQIFQINGQKIAVITYTNSACDEIKSRLEYDSLFSISTIHSFTWELIKNYQLDIKNWVRTNLGNEIADLEIEKAKGRQGTKTAFDRERKIESKKNRLANLNNIKRFMYNPNGDNRSRDSLNHSEVIDIGAYFLENKILMQKIFIRKFPILLIDESQDTNKKLMDAFFNIQKENANNFSLGLFGDMMQRIYFDGKEDLRRSIPTDWAKPEIIINYRCPKRIIRLINKTRSYVDEHQQVSREDKEEGYVRLFIVNTNVSNKSSIEKIVTEKMADITGDALWTGEKADVKFLILEHHMAARRMGFLELFEPLYKIEQFRTGLLDGSLSGVNFFAKLILPLVEAKQKGDDFAVARIVKNNSTFLSKDNLKGKKDQLEQLGLVNNKVNSLLALWNNNTNPKLIEILQNIATTKLFDLPDTLLIIANRSVNEMSNIETDVQQSVSEEKSDETIDAWDKALSSSFSHIKAYEQYISGKAPFDTHQGIKGLEFDRVMVILDDAEARGFSFSYEKLLGAKPPSETDIRNQEEGKETGIDRTRRLFYVTCSRAEKSLAIVAYTNESNKVKEYALSQGWFEKNEIEFLTE